MAQSALDNLRTVEQTMETRFARLEERSDQLATVLDDVRTAQAVMEAQHLEQQARAAGTDAAWRESFAALDRRVQALAAAASAAFEPGPQSDRQRGVEQDLERPELAKLPDGASLPRSAAMSSRSTRRSFSPSPQGNPPTAASASQPRAASPTRPPS